MPETTAELAAATELATALAFALARLDREISLRHEPGSLRPGELAVLSDLASAGASTPGALAAVERMRPASLTRHIASLERLGFIRRAKVDGDLRQVMLTVTGKGRAALAEAVRGAWLAKRVAQLTPAEQDALRAAIPVLAALYDTRDETVTDDDPGEYPQDD